jgi:sugar phosphate isomerase/epimerase
MADQLMNLFWSSAGIYPMESEVSPFDFEARVKSAASAGFGGFSFWHTDLEAICATRPVSEVRRILDDNGLTTFEVEFIEDWFVEGAREAASDKRKWWLLEVSEALDAHHVKVGDFRNTPVEMPRLIDAFAALCADAARHKATIGFEFMKSAMIHEWATASRWSRARTPPMAGSSSISRTPMRWGSAIPRSRRSRGAT